MLQFQLEFLNNLLLEVGFVFLDGERVDVDVQLLVKVDILLKLFLVEGGVLFEHVVELRHKEGELGPALGVFDDV